VAHKANSDTKPATTTIERRVICIAHNTEVIDDEVIVVLVFSNLSAQTMHMITSKQYKDVPTTIPMVAAHAPWSRSTVQANPAPWAMAKLKAMDWTNEKAVIASA
jgi:hypothetical protein